LQKDIQVEVDRWESLVENDITLTVAATPCVNGEAGGYPCKNMDLFSVLSHSVMGSSGQVNDIWGWTDPLTGKEYALVGQTTGTAFVDITDPVNPIFKGTLKTATTSSSWRDIKVYKDG
jgi:choice-of-anchor B domain-containing protein